MYIFERYFPTSKIVINIYRRIRKECNSSRLVISSHKLSPTGYKELIGCMSFGVSSLLQKSSSNTDTYYLLNRAIGMKKHLRIGQVSVFFDSSPQFFRKVTVAVCEYANEHIFL